MTIDKSSEMYKTISAKLGFDPFDFSAFPASSQRNDSDCTEYDPPNPFSILSQEEMDYLYIFVKEYMKKMVGKKDKKTADK